MSGENQYPNLKRFTSTKQPANRGRKPSYLKKYLKDNHIGTTDIRMLLGGILTNFKSLDDMKEKLKDPKIPPVVLFPLKCMLKDFVNNRLDTYKFLVQYAYGMPKQEIESKNLSIAADLNHEERAAAIDELLSKRNTETKHADMAEEKNDE